MVPSFKSVYQCCRKKRNLKTKLMLKKYNTDATVADEIESLLLSNNNTFNWFYNNSTVSNYAKNKGEIDSPQLIHQFFSNDKVISPYFNEITKLLFSFKLPFKKVQFHRIKANLTHNITGAAYNKHQPIHKDSEEKDFKSFLYYVNDSDGDTLFFNDEDEIIERISPKKGMGVLFDSNVKHAAQNPIDSYKRLVVNYVWRVL